MKCQHKRKRYGTDWIVIRYKHKRPDSLYYAKGEACPDCHTSFGLVQTTILETRDDNINALHQWVWKFRSTYMKRVIFINMPEESKKN